ncbi:bis(5'-nucleosyl)-tetraphosphatase (symmetrical) YqeK [Acaryochloris sp. IP29b_bin.148]|uniref:bis(5'-nucleosyl)-tetraphosphatase (symmetrical) YqeK n=1 Tax=Acaryochloris sp. IP29b_bin.148 TaxID=2969218 RepID=UPI002628233A|nr:bis(5'-nucleosyl)-tetraphosphatase (symmetrical) YqeK [Acaryochloris sp. IP29b_bin.148]
MTVATPPNWDRASVITWLTDNVPPARVKHILRVETLSQDLAQQHQLNEAQAAQAGLMHDLAKYFPPKRLLQTARQHQLPIDPIDEANPHLLHAQISAIVAQEEFKITDPELLAAIRNHTLGQPQMSLLSCVVFLADSLEPGRGNHPQLQAVREISRQNLYHAVALVCDLTMQHLLKTQRLIHPRMVLTRNWAWLQIQS